MSALYDVPMIASRFSRENRHLPHQEGLDDGRLLQGKEHSAGQYSRSARHNQLRKVPGPEGVVRWPACSAQPCRHCHAARPARNLAPSEANRRARIRGHFRGAGQDVTTQFRGIRGCIRLALCRCDESTRCASWQANLKRCRLKRMIHGAAISGQTT
jgi:hypothetical protein